MTQNNVTTRLFERDFHSKSRMSKKEHISLHRLQLKLQSFIARNAFIVKQAPDRAIGEMKVCNKCLKAHAYRLGKEMEISNESLHKIMKMIPGDIGHEGYYVDEEDLIKLYDQYDL